MPLDSLIQSKDETQATGLYRAIIERLPDPVRLSFTQTQRESLEAAAAAVKFGDHPVDIRLSLPTLFNRYYLVLLAGHERRSKERRRIERARYPFAKVCNILFIAAVMGVGGYLALCLGALVLLSLFSGAPAG